VCAALPEPMLNQTEIVGKQLAPPWRGDLPNKCDAQYWLAAARNALNTSAHRQNASGSTTERLASLQAALKCGTECGACRPTLQRLVKATT